HQRAAADRDPADLVRAGAPDAGGDGGTGDPVAAGPPRRSSGTRGAADVRDGRACGAVQRSPVRAAREADGRAACHGGRVAVLQARNSEPIVLTVTPRESDGSCSGQATALSVTSHWLIGRC